MDNERLIADSLVKILNLHGYEAVGVYNPTQAMEYAASNLCDLLISDVVVHGHMSGVELAIEFSKLQPLCKVLLISGNSLTADHLKSAEKQGYSFEILAKPVHPEELLKHIQTLTGRPES